MFSHIAEETTRLAHGFLGALFSVIIVFSKENPIAIAILCVGLYLVFISNTIFLHFLYKVMNEEMVASKKYILWMLSFLIITVVGSGLLFVGFCLKDVSFFKLLDETYQQLKVGVLVHAMFLFWLNVSHINAMYIAKSSG